MLRGAHLIKPHNSSQVFINMTRGWLINQNSFHLSFLFLHFCTAVISKKIGRINKDSIQNYVRNTFPMFQWLRTYTKDDFTGDLISGLTVSIMQIPQGMGYALLGNVPPVVGIYMGLLNFVFFLFLSPIIIIVSWSFFTAFFPVLLYVLLGTSRHNSMGNWPKVLLPYYR